MELKQIETENILANLSQPRENFDKEKIKELSESILGNGLINPIIVRNDTIRKGKYLIVAGERRFMAHKLAKIKKISAFVKEYKNDGEWMVESLIENVHREDLKDWEKAKYLKKIKDIENISTKRELSKKVKMNERVVSNLLDLVEPGSIHISKSVEQGEITEHHFRVIKNIENKETQKKILEKIKREDLSTSKTEKLTSIIKKSPEDVKEALLDDKINVEQAERISKLKTEQQREKAIQEHTQIKMVDRNIEKNIEHQQSAKEKREFDNRLIQSKTWVNSFRSSVTDSRTQIEKTIKILLLATQFIGVMDDKQKERLDYDLSRFIETLEKGEQLSEQIKDKIK